MSRFVLKVYLIGFVRENGSLDVVFRSVFKKTCEDYAFLLAESFLERCVFIQQYAR